METLHCPKCQNQLLEDKKNPGKVLCYKCKKRYDGAKVEEYWRKVAIKKRRAEQQAMMQQQSSTISAKQEESGSVGKHSSGFTDKPRVEDNAAKSGQHVRTSDTTQIEIGEQKRPAHAAIVADDQGTQQRKANKTGKSTPAHAKTKSSSGESNISVSIPQTTVGKLALNGDSLSVLAIVCGVIALIVCFVPMISAGAIAFGIVGAALAGLAFVQSRKGKSSVSMLTIIAAAVCLIALVTSLYVNINAAASAESVNPTSSENTVETNTVTDENSNESASSAAQNATPAMSVNDTHVSASKDVKGSDELAWNAYSFTYDGKDFKLYDVSLGDFISQCGLKYESGYSGDNELKAGTDTYVFAVSDKYPNLIMSIDVDNTSDEDKKMSECQVASITVESVDGSAANLPKVSLPGGVKIGMTTDEVIHIYGSPTETWTPSDPALKYVTYLYSEGDKAFSPLRLTFASGEGGPLTGILMESPQLWE